MPPQPGHPVGASSSLFPRWMRAGWRRVIGGRNGSDRGALVLPDPTTLDPAARFVHIAAGLDTAPLLAEVEAEQGRWFDDTSRQRKVRCQRDTLNIFLRAARKPLPPGARNANDVHETRTMRAAANFPEILSFCRRVASLQEGELGRVALVALLPQGWVRPHTDFGAYYRIRDRFHLVLRSAGGSALTAGGQAVVMREGELWAFDNKVRHEARNPSDERRIHLIFDVLPGPGRGYFARAPAA